MRKGRIALLGVAIAVLAFLIWWIGHKGGGGVHDDSAAAPAAGSAAPRVDHAKPMAGASIGGRVTDDAGQPIAGAVVRAADASGGEPIVARAGADGSYQLDDLAPGRYVLSASAAGFLPEAHDPITVPLDPPVAIGFRLQRGGRPLTGTVTDATGGPIGGVLVEAARLRGALAGTAPDVAAAFTDDVGHYALAVADGAYRVRASHAEYVGASRRVDVGASGATADFALVPGGAIEGTVEDAATGQGVAGATVAVEREAIAGPLGGRGARGRTSVVADGAGHFRVAGLEPGAIALRGNAPGRSSIDPTVVPLGVAEQVSGVVVVVQAAPSVSGVVVDEAGKPAPRAEAFLVGPGAFERTVADDAGAFAFEGVKPGKYQVQAGGAPYLDSAAPVPIAVERVPITGVKVVVRRGAFIRGRVDPPGAAHVEVARDPVDNVAQLDLRALVETRAGTDAKPDGTFELGPVEPGSIDVAARAPDGRRGRVTVAVAKDGADGVVIALEAGATLGGRVTDGKDPVAGAVVTARRVKAHGRTAVIVGGVDIAVERAPTGADGRFSVAGLAPGDYQLAVLDDRGATYAWRAPTDKQRPAAPITVAIAAGETKEVALEVERPNGTITGVVLGADGAPVADAWVSASRGFDEASGLSPLAGGASGGGASSGAGPATGGGATNGGGSASGAGSGASSGGSDAGGERSSMMVVQMDDDGDGDAGIFGGVPPVLTDASGRFALAHLRRGTYSVRAEGLRGTARGAQPDVTPDADITIRLAPLTELSGTVTANGAAVGDFTITLDGPARRSQRFLAADGRFTMQRVDPGAYQVTASAPEGDGHAQVTVAAGQHTDVPLALVGHAHVVGRIVDASGAPIAGAPVVSAPVTGDGKVSVQIEGPPDTTLPDGRFAIEVEPGQRLLLVLGNGGPIAEQPFDAKTGATVDLGTITAAPHSSPPHH